MCRILARFAVVIIGVYGGACFGSPGIVAVIDGVDYSNSFVVTPTAQGFSIAASISSLFALTFDATSANANPDIDYRLSIGGDPTVQLTITQSYLGGPFYNVAGTSSATITDANLDGHASLVGLPLVNTISVAGAIAGQYDSGCDLTGPPGFTTACASSQFNGVGPNVVDPTVQLKIAFSLTDDDFVTLNGSATLTVPEPATGCLLVSGMLAAVFILRNYSPGVSRL